VVAVSFSPVMKGEPISLTDSQLAVVQNVAAGLPPLWKERFLSKVADGLIGRRAISDVDVQRVISAAHRSIVFGVGDPPGRAIAPRERPPPPPVPPRPAPSARGVDVVRSLARAAVAIGRKRARSDRPPRLYRQSTAG
jgi:hypothetical protein